MCKLKSADLNLADRLSVMCNKRYSHIQAFCRYSHKYVSMRYLVIESIVCGITFIYVNVCNVSLGEELPVREKVSTKNDPHTVALVR